MKDFTREEICHCFNSYTGCKVVLCFDNNGWYVESYDSFTNDFYWCLQYKVYSEAVKCYEYERDRKEFLQ